MKEVVEEGMSNLKKTIIGILTTALTGAGAYVTTHIDQLFGVEEEAAPIEQVDQASEPAPVEQKAEQNVNVQGPTINLTIPQQQPQTRVIERVIEKPVATPAPAPVKEVEDEDPW